MSPPPDKPFAIDDSQDSASAIEVQSETSDFNGGDVNAPPPRKSAWRRPSNGVSEGGSVMGGAVSWPALSESTMPVPRSSTDFSRPIRDAPSQSSQEQPISNSNPKSTPNHPRHRSRNQSGIIGSGAGGTSSGGGPSHGTLGRHLSQAPPPFPVVPSYQYIQPAVDTTMTGSRPVRGVGGSQPHSGNDHSSNRSSSRRVNYGSRPRAEGQYHNNHGGRRDQDHREVVFMPPYVNPAIRFVTPPIAPAAPPSFLPPAPPLMSIFPQVGIDMSSFIYSPTIPPMAIRPPPGPMPSSSSDMPLKTMILNQIDYYFSDENLIKDPFLRSNMDDNGWVPITLIASFRQVERLTNDIPLILESLMYSDIVEVQGDKVRRRDEWSKWLLPSVPRFRTSSVNTVAASLQ